MKTKQILIENSSGVEFDINELPDAWHIATRLNDLGNNEDAKAILELWHKAHAMRDVIIPNGGGVLV